MPQAAMCLCLTSTSFALTRTLWYLPQAYALSLCTTDVVSVALLAHELQQSSIALRVPYNIAALVFSAASGMVAFHVL